MRLVIRSAAAAFLAVLAAILLAVATTMTSVALAATALIMGGTGHPLINPPDSPVFIGDYVNGADNNFIEPSGLCGMSPCTLVAVYTPEQFRFDTGFTDMTFDKSVAAGKANLDNCIRSGTCIAPPPPNYSDSSPRNVSDPTNTYVVYGYSQSATVATLEKRDLIANPEPGKIVYFVLTANPNKPNGGILERFEGLYISIIGVTFNGATPNTLPDGQTPTDMLTVDVSRQYDGWTDWPTNPLNLLADINAGLGIFYLHGNYFGVGDPVQQGQYGDTTYYLIATPVLPLLMPIDQVPFIGHALAVTLDPFFRVLVEAGYARTINPGQPTPAKWLYFPNPVATLVNLVIAIPTGLDNGISTFTGTRPFGTTEPGPYGVGGPPVDTGCGTATCTGPTLSTMTSMSSFAVAQPDPGPSAPEPKLSDVTTLNTPALPQITRQNPKPGTKPSITKFDILTVPQLPKKPTQPVVRKPAGLNLPRLRDLVPSLAGAVTTPKPRADGDGTPVTGDSSTPTSTGDSTNTK
jgi:hypothetical protein